MLEIPNVQALCWEGLENNVGRGQDAEDKAGFQAHSRSSSPLPRILTAGMTLNPGPQDRFLRLYQKSGPLVVPKSLPSPAMLTAFWKPGATNGHFTVV